MPPQFWGDVGSPQSVMPLFLSQSALKIIGSCSYVNGDTPTAIAGVLTATVCQTHKGTGDVGPHVQPTTAHQTHIHTALDRASEGSSWEETAREWGPLAWSHTATRLSLESIPPWGLFFPPLHAYSSSFFRVRSMPIITINGSKKSATIQPLLGGRGDFPRMGTMTSFLGLFFHEEREPGCLDCAFNCLISLWVDHCHASSLPTAHSKLVPSVLFSGRYQSQLPHANLMLLLPFSENLRDFLLLFLFLCRKAQCASSSHTPNH